MPESWSSATSRRWETIRFAVRGFGSSWYLPLVLLVLLYCCESPQAHVPWRHRVVARAAKRVKQVHVGLPAIAFWLQLQPLCRAPDAEALTREVEPDRKSTRLNSSHLG